MWVSEDRVNVNVFSDSSDIGILGVQRGLFQRARFQRSAF